MKADAEAIEVCLHINTQSDSIQVETASSSVRASVEGVWTDSGPRESLSLHPGGLTEPIHTDTYIHSTDTHAIMNTDTPTNLFSFFHSASHTHIGQDSSGQACQPALVSCMVQMAFVFVSWKSSWCPRQLKFSSNLTWHVLIAVASRHQCTHHKKSSLRAFWFILGVQNYFKNLRLSCWRFSPARPHQKISPLYVLHPCLPTHTNTHAPLCFASALWHHRLFGRPEWKSFFFFWLARGFSSELLSLLLTVIHFINSCLHATLQHCFWTCSDNQIYSPGPEVTHKQGGCVVFVAGSQELGETQRDSPGLFISLSPITCAWVLHVEFLTVLNGIKDDECGN